MKYSPIHFDAAKCYTRETTAKLTYIFEKAQRNKTSSNLNENVNNYYSTVCRIESGTAIAYETNEEMMTDKCMPAAKQHERHQNYAHAASDIFEILLTNPKLHGLRDMKRRTHE